MHGYCGFHIKCVSMYLELIFRNGDVLKEGQAYGVHGRTTQVVPPESAYSHRNWGIAWGEATIGSPIQSLRWDQVIAYGGEEREWRALVQISAFLTYLLTMEFSENVCQGIGPEITGWVWRKVGKKDLHDALEMGAERRERPRHVVFYRDGGETRGLGFREEREVKTHSKLICFPIKSDLQVHR